MKRFFTWLSVYLKPFLNIRFLICFMISWMITNGWSYLFILFGGWWDIAWMQSVGVAYLAFLWIPVTPEKILTVAIALILHKIFFSNDQKSRKLLLDIQTQAKHDWSAIKLKLKRKKDNIDKDNQL